MIQFTLVVRPMRSAVAFGGWSAPSRGGDKATARDGEGHLVLPASALRGALRYELERLLAGDGQRGCSAHRLEGTDVSRPCACPVCRLFGEGGGATGSLRLMDATLIGDDAKVTPLRSTIAVSRGTGTVVTGHLGFTETSDVLGDEPDHVFRAQGFLVPLSSDEGDVQLAEDRRNLQAACEALTTLGGGRARGLGWVRCSLEEESEPSSPALKTSSEGARERDLASVELRFTAEAPFHFGLGRSIAFFQPTLPFAPGSTVRGALAYAILEGGFAKPEDVAFQQLVDPAGEVTFGSARPTGFAPCATRRKCRPNGHVFDALMSDLLRRKAAEHGVALAAGKLCRYCAEATKLLDEPWTGGDGPRPRRRVRTRTALNRKTGTSMDQRLFSIEVLEQDAVVAADEARDETTMPLVLSARVNGLPAEAERLIRKLDGRGLWLGGKRSQGMGRCRLRVAKADVVNPAQVAREAATLGESLRQGWKLVESVDRRELPALLADDQDALAIVLDEPWFPAEGASPDDLRQGPFTGEESGQPIGRFLELTEEGRFGAVEARRYGGVDLDGEKPPVVAAAPGSVFVYAVARDQLAARLDEWLARGESGAGLYRELGWGRFHIWGTH